MTVAAMPKAIKLRRPGEACRTLSLEMQERARQLIPGMTQLLSKRPDQFAPGAWPGYYERAQGVEVWDLDGNKYVDMSIGGIGANVLGYADPDVDDAVRRAIAKGTSCSLNCPEEVELAELLCRLHPWARRVRYARTGGESMAMAVRIARAYTRRDVVAFCGYHGWHDWYLAANVGTENALGEHLLSGLEPNGVPRGLAGTALPFRYNRLDELREIVAEHKNDLAAVVMEPIRNDPPATGFLEGVRQIADEIGAVLVIDEVSAGFRMNSGGSHLLLNVTPDIAVFSKAIGNGYPIAAVIGRAEVMEAAQTSFISSTNWTERVGPAAAIATIEKHERLRVGEHLMALGTSVQAGWKEAARRSNLKITVGGIPPLAHFSFNAPNGQAVKALYVTKMLDRGFLASTSFYAMYAHTPEHVRTYLDATSEVFEELARLLETGNVEAHLTGKPATAGFKRLL